MRPSVCHNLKLVAAQGSWYRAVQLDHYQSLLSFEHTRTIPTRFQAGIEQRPGFPALYFAENQQVALLECGALLGANGDVIANSKSRVSWAIISVEVSLTGIVDLTRKSIRRHLQTSIQELTGDWRGYRLRRPNIQPPPPYFTSVPTQRLGQALYWVPEVEGIISYSAKAPTERNLVVFPDKILSGNYLKFHNPITRAIDRIPG